MIKSIGYPGSKRRFLKYLLPLMPITNHYCEVFGGSGIVLLNRPRSNLETFNDINLGLVNFFKVLRVYPGELIRQLKLTPRSRFEYDESVKELNRLKKEDMPSVEHARMFYTVLHFSFSKKMDAWSYCVNIPGGSGANGDFNYLYAISERFSRVQIECDSFENIIQRYNSQSTLFYCDPPYLSEDKKDLGFYPEKSNMDKHIKLSELLHNTQGKCVISMYDHDWMDDLYGDFYKIKLGKPIFATISTNRSTKKNSFIQEYVWTNYDPYKLEGSARLF